MSLHRPVLIHGPYAPPNVKVGDAITCAIRGLVEVRGWHDKAAISVPLGGVKGTRWAIVVSHDLLRALPVETGVAICFYWSVAEPTVARWRQALGIDSRATESFRRSSSGVGSVTGRAPGVAERLRALNARPWTAAELELLQTHSTREAASLTSRTVEAVERAKTRYGITQQRTSLHCLACGHRWLPQENRVPKRCPNQQCRHPLV